jgi:acetyltransferase-like isoleucine patch superfamily enzyme
MVWKVILRPSVKKSLYPKTLLLKFISVKKILKIIIYWVLSGLYKLYLKYFSGVIKRVICREQQCRVDKVPFRGEGVRLNGEITITGRRQVALGCNVHIGDGTYFNSEGGMAIGDNTHISRNVSVYTVNHDWNGHRLPYDEKLLAKPVFIGRNVWIGQNVGILPGCIIGEGAILSMGAVVVKDVPRGLIVGGNPAIIIGQRNRTHYQKHLDAGSIGGVNGEKLNVDIQSRPITDSGVQPVFILGTGRCGTKYLASLLSQESMVCRHEPNAVFIKWITAYVHGEVSEVILKERIWMVFEQLSFLPISCTVYGESDQKFSFCIPVLKKLFPDAMFIWLKRDPASFLASVIPRGWYDDYEMGFSEVRGLYYEPHDNSLHGTNRVRGDKTKQVSPTKWQGMSEFERCCWYYTYANSVIEEAFTGIPKTNALTLATEELDDPLIMGQVAKFLNLEFRNLSTQNRSEERNVSSVDRYVPEKWTAEEKRIFNEWFENQN